MSRPICSLLNILLKKVFVSTLFIGSVILVCFCGVSRPVTDQGHGKISRAALLQKIRIVYPDYRSLRAQFSIEGKVKDQQIYFLGELDITEKKELGIKIIEPILKAILFEFQWRKNSLVYDNKIRDKRSEKVLKKTTQLLIFGRGIPQAFAFWPLRVQSHRLINSSDSQFNSQKLAFQIKNSNTTTLLIFTKEGKLQKVLYREKEKIVIFEIEDHIKYAVPDSKGSGYFYKTIYVYNNFSKDHFKIKINKIKLIH